MTTRGLLLGATALSLLAAGPALAQEAAAQPAPATAPAGAATPADEAEAAAPAPAPAASSGQTVIVTGSRIRRSSFNTPSALQIVTNENAVLSGTIDAAEVLQGSTAAAGTQQINNFFTGFIVEGGPGIQTVGLNSLGAQRTLVLLNGRRLPPSGTRGQTGAVDLATIPNLAISRYEILNEGASPIYGSDAVGGVVNAITRRDVDGWEVNGSRSFTFDGGAEDTQIGVLWGKTEDRWNLMVSASYFQQNALKYGDRDFCLEDYVFNADTGARADFIDPRTGRPRCFGIGFSFNRIAPGGSALTGTGTWVADANEVARRVGTNPTTGAANTLLAIPGWRRLFSPPIGVTGEPVANQVEYNHPLVAATDIVSPSERFNIYATGAIDLDILGGVELYGEFLGARRISEQERAAQLFFSNVDPVLQANYIFNPFSVGTTARIAVQPVIVRPANNNQEVDTYQAVAGVRGQTGGGLFAGLFRNGDWEVYLQTSRGEGIYEGTTILLSRIEDALRATLVNGQPTCTPSPLSLTTTCVPVNFFDPRVVSGNLTAAEYNYLYADPGLNTGNTVYEQTVFEANVAGDLFQIPGAADAVKANLGFHHRTYSIDDVPGVISRTQLRPGVSNQALTTSAGITRGEDSVNEVYVEVVAPLIAQKPLIEALELTAAYRFTDYESYSSNETYKFTLSWQVTPEFTLIGMAGTSYRAPALFELFLGDQTGFTSQTGIDPCVNYDQSNNQVIRQRCRDAGIPGDYNGAGSSATVITGGGLGTLKEEESTSQILSLVYSPTAFDLDLRIDAWQISVTDQVAQFGAGNILFNCYADTTGRAANFCRLFTRAPGNDPVRPFNILTVQNDYVNINETEVEGIDLKLVYRMDLAQGNLTIDNAYRWTNRNAEGLFSDSELLELQGTIGEPVFNGSTQIRFDRQDWTYAWTVTSVGPTRAKYFNGGNPVVAAPPGSYYAYNGVSRVLYRAETETTIYHDASIRWQTDDWTVVGAVSNLFDEKPPAISTGAFFARLGTGPLASQYDFAGRAAVVQVVRRF